MTLKINGSTTEKAGLHMFTKYHEAVMAIDVENLTKLVNREWMSTRPELESHNMGPHANVVNHISRGCGKYLLRKLLRKFPTNDHYVKI
jgi:hypothetical protein